MTAATDPLDDLTRRLEKLERQNRWLKHAGLALLLVLGCAFALGADDKSASKTLETTKLLLSDEQGKQRGWLLVTRDGIALAYTGGGAGPRSGLLLNADGAVLRYFDAEGRPGSGVCAQATGIGVGARSAGGKLQTNTDALLEGVGNALQADAIFAPKR